MLLLVFFSKLPHLHTISLGGVRSSVLIATYVVIFTILGIFNKVSQGKSFLFRLRLIWWSKKMIDYDLQNIMGAKIKITEENQVTPIKKNVRYTKTLQLHRFQVYIHNSFD